MTDQTDNTRCCGRPPGGICVHDVMAPAPALPIDPHAPSLEFLPYPQQAPNACRSTRHCAEHGWCRRCDPAFAAAMSRVNAAIQHTDPDSSHWGPLYAAVGQALRGAYAPDSPEGMLASAPGSKPPADATAEIGDDGPSIAEAAADDRRWFDGEKAGE